MKKIDLKRNPFVKDICKKYDLKTIVEVGTYRGAFANQLFQTEPNRLYLIDPWQKWDTKIFPDYTELDSTDWEALHKKVATRFQPYNNVTIIRDISVNAVKQFQNESIDLVYIDGNHTYDFVTKDLEIWWPKIKKGGFISGHDYQLKGVTQAVTEFCNTNGVEIEYLTNEKGCASYFIRR